jgi:hypothetical protein
VYGPDNRQPYPDPLRPYISQQPPPREQPPYPDPAAAYRDQQQQQQQQEQQQQPYGAHAATGAVPPGYADPAAARRDPLAPAPEPGQPYRDRQPPPYGDPAGPFRDRQPFPDLGAGEPASRIRTDPGRGRQGGRLYLLIAAALAGIVVVVVAIGLASGGGRDGGGAEAAKDGRQDLQGFVNGAPDQERDAGAADDAAGDQAGDPDGAGNATEQQAPQGDTAQVRLVGPSRATAGEPFRVVAAFRDVKGAKLRAYVQAMRPDGKVGETKAVASCRLDTPGEQDTLTGTCPAVAAGSYRLAVVVERTPYRPGDFPPVDVGRLVVAAESQGTSSSGGGPGGEVPAPDSVRAVERRMVELTNDARREAGVGPLSVDTGLTEASRDWACDMAGRQNLQHDPNFADSGAQGENVAFRTDPGDDVALLLHEQFMNSPPHRENLLNPRWNEIGIGFCARNGFWVTERFAP